ncbi:MAG: hypothetical protein SchgKO_08330 [Schleiferiaceae bacterium]
MGQNLSEYNPPRHKAENLAENLFTKQHNSSSNKTTSATIHWSEDFAGGIPTGWTSVCLDTNNAVNPAPEARWVYRGPNTSPNKDTGSIGGYSGFDPILSPSQGNGFVIFDSDYLDNAGIAQNFGNGLAPTPHLGQLTTDTIDLSGLSPGTAYRLQFYSYARKFAANYRVLFSGDGGITWPDTVALYNVPSAYTTAPFNTEEMPLPASLAGNSQVMIRFEMGENDGYYFWMIDDLEIVEPPKHAVEWIPISPFQNVDVINNGHVNSGRYGYSTLKQIRSQELRASVWNSGSQPQTNCYLSSEIWNSAGLITTLNSPTISVLNPGDTIWPSDLSTPSWVPTQTDTLLFITRFVSDSLGGTNHPTIEDSIMVRVSDSLMSLDYNHISNYIGSPNYDIKGLASMFEFLNDERLFSVEVRIGPNSQVGGKIVVAVIDTDGANLLDSVPNTLLAYGEKTLGIDDIDTLIRISLNDANGNIPYLTSGSYYIITYLDNSQGEVTIANDATIAQNPIHSLLYVKDTRWFAGISGSWAVNAPWIRAYICAANNAAACMSGGPHGNIGEHSLLASVYPNPAGEYFEIAVDESGDYTWEAYTVLGQKVAEGQFESTGQISQRVPCGDWKPGSYILTISQGNKRTQLRLQIQ